MPRLDPHIETNRDAAYRLTAVEFDVVWEALGLGPPPVVLRLASPGRTRAERRALCAASWRALSERGLAGPSGPDDGLSRLLLLLRRPGPRLELRGWWGRSVRAVATEGSETGVLVTRHADAVAVAPCDSLPAGLVGVAPRSEAGPGLCTTVPTAVLAAALTAQPAERRAELRRQDVPAAEASLLARLLGGVRGRAQIVAAATDESGVARRAGGVLGILDGARGRYLLTRAAAEDGVEWTTVAPTDDRRLRYRVAELLTGAGPEPV